MHFVATRCFWMEDGFFSSFWRLVLSINFRSSIVLLLLARGCVPSIAVQACQGSGTIYDWVSRSWFFPPQHVTVSFASDGPPPHRAANKKPLTSFECGASRRFPWQPSFAYYFLQSPPAVHRTINRSNRHSVPCALVPISLTDHTDEKN